MGVGQFAKEKVVIFGRQCDTLVIRKVQVRNMLLNQSIDIEWQVKVFIYFKFYEFIS